MRKWSIETLSLAGVGAVLALLIGLGAITCRDMSLASAACHQVELGHERLSWIEHLRAGLYRAQAEQHHYLAAPNGANHNRRDATVAAVARALAQDARFDGDSPGRRALRQLQTLVQAQVALQSSGPGGDAREAAPYLEQAGAVVERIVALERAALADTQRAETTQSGRARFSLIALLLSQALVITFILLKIRSLTLSRKAALTLLQANETRSRQIVETGHEGIWLTDAQACITFANQRVADMLGYRADELIGRSIYAFLGQPLVPGECPIFQAGDGAGPDDGDGNGGPLRDLCYRRRDGSLGWAIVSGRRLRDADGAPSGALVMATDITERKLAEQALCVAHAELENRIRLRTAQLEDANDHLRAEIDVRTAAERALADSEQRLQEIISMMPLALFLKDADSRVVLMNEACEQQWGVRHAQLAGDGERNYFPPEQMAGFLANDRAAFATRRLVVNEELIWNATLQSSRLVQTYKKPIFDAAGAPLMLIAMSVDITDSKRNEEALRQSLIQLRALSDHQQTIKEEERKRIALDIHDDLGQNLMALRIDVSMLHSRTGANHPRLNQQVERVLETIDSTIKSVRAIINDLHPSTLELGLCAAVEWLLKQFERRGAINYRLLIHDDSASVKLDNRQTAAIFRVVQESLTNIVRHAQASAVEVSLKLGAHWISVVISDNGIGMLPGDHGKAASYGLKSIKERIGALGGEVTIDSHPGGGTVLAILMPVAAGEQARAAVDACA